MHRFADILGLSDDHSQDRRKPSGKPEACRRIIVLEGRPLFRDMFAYALRHALPEVEVETVSALGDIHRDRHQVIVFNFVGRHCDFDAVQSVLRRLRDAFPDLPVVMVMEQVPEGVPELVSRRGFAGCAASLQGIEALMSAVCGALAGRTLSIMRENPARTLSAEGSAFPEVSSRERSILLLVKQGKPNKLIAHELGISESTVKVHLRNLMCKLRVHNRTQLALTGHRPAELACGTEYRPLAGQMAAALPLPETML